MVASSEFKVERLKLFEQKLANLGYNSVNLNFQELLDSIDGSKFFQGLPEKDLKGSIDKWKRDLTSEMKEAFATYLRQIPDISYDCEMEGPKFDQIIDKLKDDIRYKRLDFAEAERTQLIRERIREIGAEHNRVKSESIVGRFVNP